MYRICCYLVFETYVRKFSNKLRRTTLRMSADMLRKLAGLFISGLMWISSMHRFAVTRGWCFRRWKQYLRRMNAIGPSGLGQMIQQWLKRGFWLQTHLVLEKKLEIWSQTNAEIESCLVMHMIHINFSMSVFEVDRFRLIFGSVTFRNEFIFSIWNMFSFI